MNERHLGQKIADLAPLEVADHVPSDTGGLGSDVGSAGKELLGSVLAKVFLPEGDQGADVVEPDGLGDRHEANGLGGPAAGQGGLGDFVPDAAEVGGNPLVGAHALHLSGGPSERQAPLASRRRPEA